MRPLRACLLILGLIAPAATLAEGERSGEFDYYVMSLSWSTNWCELTGDARQSPQCDAAKDHGWTLHGLWPQFTRGYPSYCQSGRRPPSRAQTGAMADIMGTGGLAWHQWKKHGSCSGLDPADYFALSREAYARIKRPEVFRKLDRTVSLPAAVVEEAFLKANPDLTARGITITCKQGHIQEARICLSRELEFIPCGPDVRRDCTLDNALFTPLR